MGTNYDQYNADVNTTQPTAEGHAKAQATRGSAAKMATIGLNAVWPQRERKGLADTQDEAAAAQLGLKLKRGTEITPKSQGWLVRDFLPADTLVVVAGAPGIGKTTACLSWAAAITNGREPITGGARDKANVLMLSNEDSEAQLRSIFTRLGGDLSRLYVEDEESYFPWGIGDVTSLAAHMLELRPAMVIVDSLTTHKPSKADLNAHGEVAPLLVALRKAAAAHGATIVLIHHTNKAATSDPLAKISGSIGISATARHVLLVAPHPEDGERRVVAVCKSNLVKPGTLSHQFTLEPFCWDGTTGLSAEDLLQASHGEEEGSGTDAERFLREALADGREDSVVLARQAESGYGISRRTLQRAVGKLGIRKETTGFGSARRVYWSLPTPIDDTISDTHKENVVDAQEPINTPLFDAGSTINDTIDGSVADVSLMGGEITL